VTYIVAGEVCVASEPAILSTVLGSCVAVCLWSPQARVGGINHYLVPRSLPGEHSLMAGDRAIPALVEQVLSAMRRQAGESGSRPLKSQPSGLAERTSPRVYPRSLIAKVFGGAHTGQHDWNAGAENILVAWSELRKAGIPIVAADVGGADSRRISFQLASGQVQVQRTRAGAGPQEPR
jgi:chemotaxis protein CheD